MTRIYLIRHAQSEGNLYRRALGWYDGHVTALGWRQTAALEERFLDVPVQAVYSSDLSRARETARAITAPKGLEPRWESAFREINLGELTNIPYGDLAYHHPDLYEAFFSYSPRWVPRGGETFQQVAERMAPAFFRVAANHPGKTVAIFSHAMAIHCLQAALRGKHPGEVDDLPLGENTAVSCYEVQGDRFRILFENDASHLSPELTDRGQRRGRGGPPLVWFRSMDTEGESAQFYYSARQEAWETLHGSLSGFDGPGFLAEARDQLQWDPRALQQVMLRGRAVGVLQLDTLQNAGEGAGYIPFLYLRPNYRGKGIGSQLLGQAVSVYQPMGRKFLRLLCDPANEPAQRFYRRHGFVKRGQAPGAMGQLDVLEMPLTGTTPPGIPHSSEKK